MSPSLSTFEKEENSPPRVFMLFINRQLCLCKDDFVVWAAEITCNQKMM